MTDVSVLLFCFVAVISIERGRFSRLNIYIKKQLVKPILLQTLLNFNLTFVILFTVKKLIQRGFK